MALAYWIAPESRLVVVRGRGTVTEREALGLRYSLNTHPKFSRSFRELIDYRQVTSIELSAEGLKRLGMLDPYGAGSRRALVASGEEVYRLARSDEASRPDMPGTLEVFRSWLEALDWLSLTEGDLPAGEPEWSSEFGLRWRTPQVP